MFDFDQDGYSDLGDIFPSDYWQWNDTDGDGFGDNNFSSPGFQMANVIALMNVINTE